MILTLHIFIKWHNYPFLMRLVLSFPSSSLFFIKNHMKVQNSETISILRPIFVILLTSRHFATPSKLILEFLEAKERKTKIVLETQHYSKNPPPSKRTQLIRTIRGGRTLEKLSRKLQQFSPCAKLRFSRLSVPRFL
ncbi:hypothetical protein ACH5RR_029075 [Cinchona calisaya]|uniref:Ribosomal protein S10 n=1 Tax=Cinchona calisaya TaxID=153742 RepID=A0ABD2YSC3_9GENT